MVARTQSSHGLIVAFRRDGEPPETVFCQDGVRAWAHAIHLITKHEALQAGDTLQVLDATSDPDHRPELPEASRSAHYS
jgi:hypothetical protein